MALTSLPAQTNPYRPTIRPGQFSRLQNSVIRRDVPREIGGVPVVIGRGGVLFGRVIRIVPAENGAGAVIGHEVRLYEVTGTCAEDQQVRLLASEMIRLRGEYLGWRRNSVGGLGAFVEWPDTDGIARAARRLAAHP